MKHFRIFIVSLVAVAAGAVPAIALANSHVRPEATTSTSCTTLLGITLPCLTLPGSTTTSSTSSTTTATTVTAPEASAAAPTAVSVGTGTTTTASATLNGSVNLDGDTNTGCDFDYGTSTTSATTTSACTPTPTNSSTADQAVSAAVTGLTPNTTYYYDVTFNWLSLSLSLSGLTGTATSPFESFTTPALGATPAVATTSATNVGGSGATLNGTVTPNNFSITSCSFSYSTGGGTAQTANCAATATTPTSTQAVSAAVTGLAAGTTYSYTLTVGYGSGTGATTVTSSSGSVTTTAAAVAAPNPALLTATSATLDGSVYPEGQTVTDCEFYYGTTINTLLKSPCSVPVASITGTAAVAVTAAVTGLTAKTTYLDTIVLTTTGGAVAVAPLGTFTTPAVALTPKATAGAASAVTSTSAVLHAVVDAEGQGIEGCEFVFGYSSLLTTQGLQQGVAVKCTTTPSDNGNQTVTATLKGLAPGTKYYIVLGFKTYGGGVESNQITFDTKTTATKPSLKLSSFTINKKAKSAKFRFARTGSTLATKGFQCALAPVTKGKVGAIRYTKCLSGKTYTKLKAITYVFYVRDGNGVGYSAPKSHRFTL